MTHALFGQDPAHIDPPFQAPRRNLDGGQALPSNFFNDPRCDAPDGLGAVGSRSFHDLTDSAGEAQNHVV